MPTIRIEVGGQSFEAPLPDAPVTIGASEQADLRLQCGGVADKHCTLSPLPDGRHKLADGNSGYGTLLNGTSVKQVSLSEGDVIQVGEARIVYSLAGGIVDEIPSAEPAAAAVPAKPAAPKTPRPAAPARAAKPAAPAPEAAPEAAPPSPASTVPAGAPADPAKPAGPKEGEGGRRSARPATKKSGALVGVLVGVVALVGIAIAVGSFGSSGEADASLTRLFEEGKQAYERKDYGTAREKWRQVADEARNTALGREATDRLALVKRVDTEMEQRLAAVWAERLDLDAAALARARTSFETSFGAAQLDRFDEMRTKVLQAKAAWKQDELEALRAETKTRVDGARFAEAREEWRRLARAAPAGVDVSAEVAVADEALLAAAEKKADALVADAEKWIAAGQAFRSVKLLTDMVPRFEGLPAQARLQTALGKATAARDKPIEIDRTKPGPGPGPGATTDPKPAPPPIQVPTDDTQRRELEEKLNGVRAMAQVAIEKRAFKEAATVIQRGLSGVPDGPRRRALADLAVDCALAEVGLGRVIGAIHENPRRFGTVKLTDRLTVSLVDADRQMLSARVKGGSSKWRWERVSANGISSLARKMRPEPSDMIAVAGLLQVVGQGDDAQALLYEASLKGIETAQIFPVLARWKQKPIPEGGFVVHEKRFVTPEEREFLIREAAIEAALQKVDAKDAAERKAAYEELITIGEPAAERLVQALRRRRTFLISQITSSKSFTSGKYMAKLLQLLDERRKHALALIYDAQAYPYPNPQKKNQAEVEARVDQVREVWERPFDLVSQWDTSLRERIEGLTEVDTLLDQVQPGFDPNLDELKKRINEAIDIPSSADGGNREYSLKVMVYNTTLDTTAGEQEKANVRSVNRYRMMMGLLAVKIDERLVRAARGHSRHMATNGYFAHNVPDTYATPVNRTPGSRAKQQGFGGGVGENIARGPGTGHGAFMAWFRSSGHHRNMLGKGWLVMGCGRANQTWWTQLFGGGSKSLDAPDPLPAPEAPFAPDEIDRPKARDE